MKFKNSALSSSTSSPHRSSSSSSSFSLCTVDNDSLREDGQDEEYYGSVKEIGRVHSLAICDDCIVWCSESLELFIEFALISEPIRVTTLKRRPLQIVMTSIPRSVAVLDSEYVVLYRVHVNERSSVRNKQENYAHYSENDYDNTNKIECDSANTSSVCSYVDDKISEQVHDKASHTPWKESVKLVEQFRGKCTLPSCVAHLSLAVFDSRYVISWNCEQKLELVQFPIMEVCSERQCKNRLLIDSNDIFVEQHFAHCCVSAIDELFVLSEQNHLMKVTVDWSKQEVDDKYDGHVITRAHHVTSMRVNASRDASDALLAISLSNGEILLLSTFTLGKVKVIDTFYYIQEMRSCLNKDLALPSNISKSNHKYAVSHSPNSFANTEKANESLCTAIALDVSIGEHYITAMTPDGVTVFDKLTYEFNTTMSTLFSSKPEAEIEDNIQTGCSCNGSWFMYSPLEETVEYYFYSDDKSISSNNKAARHISCSGTGHERLLSQKNNLVNTLHFDNNNNNDDDEDDDNTLCDIVHATSTLPVEWMQPLLLPHTQQKDSKKSTHLRCLPSKSPINNNNSYINSKEQSQNVRLSSSSAAAAAAAETTTSTSKQTYCEMMTSNIGKRKQSEQAQGKHNTYEQAKVSPNYRINGSTNINNNNNNNDDTSIKIRKRSSSHASKAHISSVQDKPVTFGHPIKSSGYDCQPWSVQQERKRKQQWKQRATQKATNGEPGYNRVKPLRCRVMSPYPSHPLCLPYKLANNGTGAGTLAYIQSRSTFHSSAITSLCTSASGKCVFAAGADGSVLMCESKKIATGQVDANARLVKQPGAPLCCVDCNLSMHTPLLMTSSVNGELVMVKPGVRENAYISYQEQSKKAIQSAHFYYLDQFVAYTCGNTLHLVKYILDDGRDELHRARNDSHLSPSPLLSYSVEAQCITSMDGINHFASNLLLMTTSSKDIHIFDVCAQSPLRVVKDAHNRPIHHLVLNKNGRFVSTSSFMKSESAQVCVTDDTKNYNSSNVAPHSEPSSAVNTSLHLFATAGLDNTVRVWDMRQSRPVRALTFHKNTALSTIGMSFDQTGSLLTTGSEDRSLYVYDIRMSGNAPLDVIKCPDIPSALAWHPLQPTLFVGMMSGAVMSFSQR